MFNLTKGSLRQMLDGINYENAILQILNIKSIQNNQDGVTRYKVTLYDGEMQHTFGILATQKNSLVESNAVVPGCVIKLEEFAANVLSKDPPKVVIILLNFDILGKMDMPAPGGVDSSQVQKAAPAVQNENIEPAKKDPVPQSKPSMTAKSFFNNKEEKSMVQPSGKIASSGASSSSSSGAGAGGMFNGFKVTGIASLNPYQNKWAIKARIINRSAIRTWSNAKGEGKLFSCDLIDGTGEIRASGFNDQCEKFYEMMQIDSVVYISRGQLKTANKQYSTLNNDYEMTFTNDTVIEICHETDNLPHLNLTLVPLSDLINKNPNDFVDVIGVVKSMTDVTTLISKQTNKELKKRELHLVDSSKCQVNCTLWGKQAEDFDGSENPVIVLKGAKLSDYGGRSLGVLSSTILQINPDIPEAHTIRGWFDQGGFDEGGIQDLSNQNGSQGGGGGVSSNLGTVYKTLDAVRDEKLGMGDKADYFMTPATILYARKENSMYMSCPTEGCNKKVVDQNDNTYRCEKCAKVFPNFKWRMILSINVADFSESQWVTCFQESAEMILGMKADEIGDLKESNTTQFDELFSNSSFREFNFKMRAKMETYNDERRVKFSVVSIDPIDYVASSKRLLQNIKNYLKSH